MSSPPLTRAVLRQQGAESERRRAIAYIEARAKKLGGDEMVALRVVAMDLGGGVAFGGAEMSDTMRGRMARVLAPKEFALEGTAVDDSMSRFGREWAFSRVDDLLAILRDPTEAMWRAGEDGLNEAAVALDGRETSVACWRAMIDAAGQVDLPASPET